MSNQHGSSTLKGTYVKTVENPHQKSEVGEVREAFAHVSREIRIEPQSSDMRIQEQVGATESLPPVMLLQPKEIQRGLEPQSVKELWINSCKRPVIPPGPNQVETIAAIEKNKFHPSNPEGSMIKELLLKTRSVELIATASSEGKVLYRAVYIAVEWSPLNSILRIFCRPGHRKLCFNDSHLVV